MSDPSIIYVVDDDPAVLHSTRFLFESEGHRVETFANGLDLLAAYPLSRPSCVLIDHMMPGMDGLEVASRLRRLDARVPVVLVTGHPDPRIRIAASGAGVPLIEKPFAFEAFRTTLPFGTDARKPFARPRPPQGEP